MWAFVWGGCLLIPPLKRDSTFLHSKGKGWVPDENRSCWHRASPPLPPLFQMDPKSIWVLRRLHGPSRRSACLQTSLFFGWLFARGRSERSLSSLPQFAMGSDDKNRCSFLRAKTLCGASSAEGSLGLWAGSQVRILPAKEGSSAWVPGGQAN